MLGFRFYRLGLGLALTTTACFVPTSPIESSQQGTSSLAIDDPQAAHPLLGWNSFDVMATSRAGYGQTWLNEGNLRNASDAMQQKLQSAGYIYINVDSGWSSTYAWTSSPYDANGVPIPDPQRFPHGISGLADYVHQKGQKLGLYEIVGLDGNAYNGNYPIEGTSCHTQDIIRRPPALVPNGWNYEYEIDWSNPCAQAFYNSRARRYASWGVDLLKVDGTTADNGPDIKAWQTALDQAGRTMWLTVSAWPVPLSLGAEIRGAGNGVRIDTDVDCYCDTISSWTASVKTRWDDLPSWLPFVGRGHFPDLDSMPINNNAGSGVQDGINDTERQSVMTFWSMASSPLWSGGDIWFMDATAQAILTNPEVIAVDQAAVMPTQLAGGTLQIWKKPLPDGTTAVAVYNLGSAAASITVELAGLGMTGDANVRDLVGRSDLGTFTGNWTASNVPSHGSRLVKLTSLPGDGIAGYTYCSAEYQNCALGGAMDVAYGAQGSYVYESGLSGTIYCGTETFGSDPAYGATKSCYMRPHGGGGPPGFVYCASEFQSCAPSGVVDVAYGAVGSFVYRTGVTGSISCTVASFGSDPAYGWTKGCYVRPSGGGSGSGSGVAYEAEAASLGGAARVTACSGCAGGSKVGNIGNGAANRVSFPQVDVASTGNHQLIIHGASADLRRFTVSVNGGAPIVVALQTAGWTAPATATITVPLNRGINRIAIGNDSEYAPDLDRIVVW